MTTIQEVEKYYNEYISEQKKIGVNDRIFLLYEALLANGLNTHSKVVELGCGIGVVSSLIAKTVKKGSIESIDLSTESINFAKNYLKQSNLSFAAGDVTAYQPKTTNADFVTLFDVIEHIPMELHKKLFQNVAQTLSKNGLLLINIPSPSSIEWDAKNDPDALQIIDQPIALDFLIQNLQTAGLAIKEFKAYSIWKKEDYHFILAQHQQEYKNEEVQLSFVQKIKRKLWRMKINLFYKF